MRLDKSVRPPTPAAGPPMAFDIIPDILEELTLHWSSYKIINYSSLLNCGKEWG